MSKLKNEEFARTWGDAHECGSSDQHSNMDYHNNWIGRKLGTQAKQTREDCIKLCEDTSVKVDTRPYFVPDPDKLIAITP